MSEIAVDLSDAITFSDGASLHQVSELDTGDYILFFDSIDTFKAILLQLNDSFVPTDLLQLIVQNTTRSVSSTVLFTDFIQILKTGNPTGISVSDAIAFSDLVQISIINTLVNLSFSDSIAFGDVISIFLTSESNEYYRRYLNDVN